MPVSAARQEYNSALEAVPSSAHNVMSVITQAKALGGGIGLFLGKTVFLASTAGCVFSLTGFMLGSLVGLQLPGFLIGAQFGYTGGLFTRWFYDRDAALRAIEDYPTLMAYHMRLIEPSAFGSNANIHKWKRDIRSNMAKQGVAISAYYAAQEAIMRLQDDQEERLLAEIMEQTAAEAAGGGGQGF